MNITLEELDFIWNFNPGQPRGKDGKWIAVGGGMPSSGSDLFYGKFSDKISGFRNLSSKEQISFIRESIKNKDKLPSNLNRESALQCVSYFLGNNGKPTLMKASEFDAKFSPDERVYRGVHDSETLTAKQIGNQLKYGANTYQGNGDWIGGIYFASSRSEVDYYIKMGDGGHTTTAAVSKKAKLWDDSNLTCPWYETNKEYSKAGLAASQSDLIAIGGIANGYDGVIIDKGLAGKYYAMFNRQSLIIRED